MSYHFQDWPTSPNARTCSCATWYVCCSACGATAAAQMALAQWSVAHDGYSDVTREHWLLVAVLLGALLWWLWEALVACCGTGPRAPSFVRQGFWTTVAQALAVCLYGALQVLALSQPATYVWSSRGEPASGLDIAWVALALVGLASVVGAAASRLFDSTEYRAEDLLQGSFVGVQHQSPAAGVC